MRALALLFLLPACAHVPGLQLPPEAELHRAKTQDGVEIALTRYRAVGPSTGLPVVLCHGISANERNMDLDERVSMARWIASQGHEAWTMSLRGTGKSGAPAGPIHFDDYWQQDLPAVVNYVKLISGAPAITYAGHSMGGMVLYAYLSQGGQGIEAAATLGSPTRLDFGTALEPLMTRIGAKIIGPSWQIPSALGAALSAPLQGVIEDGPFQRFFYNPQSTQTESFRRLLLYGTADVAGGTALQLAEMMDTGRFLSKDKAIDYRADMAKISTPILVVAARLDRIALTPAVKDGYRALGGPKEWLLITRANGTRGEYGHMDLVIGERAADEVWSKLLEFFDRHARKEP